MNYYSHHIGDFNNATRHLSRLERGVYRDLIEYCYDSEQPLPEDINTICRKILAKTKDERTAVERMLNEFFTLVKTEGWINSRCQIEIKKYHSKKEQQINAGKASGRARAKGLKNKGKPKWGSERPFNDRSTNDEPTNNQEPITNNQEPYIEDTAKKSKKVVSPRCIAQMTEEHKDCDIPKNLEKFYDYILTHGKKYKNYDAGFRNWMRNDFGKIKLRHMGIVT